MHGFLSPIVPLLDDEAVTEVLIYGPSEVFVERKGTLSKTELRFASEDLYFRRCGASGSAGTGTGENLAGSMSQGDQAGAGGSGAPRASEAEACLVRQSAG